MTITGMHCNGCTVLIAMSLEEVGMQNIVVDLKSGVATFEANVPSAEVNNILVDIFKDLKGYSYSDLLSVN